MTRFYYHRNGDRGGPAGGPLPLARALRLAQSWLRDVTAGQLEAYFDSHEILTQADRWPVQLAAAGSVRFSLEDADSRPFATRTTGRRSSSQEPEVDLRLVPVTLADLWDDLPMAVGPAWTDLFPKVARLSSDLAAARDDDQRALLARQLVRLFRPFPPVVDALRASHDVSHPAGWPIPIRFRPIGRMPAPNSTTGSTGPRLCGTSMSTPRYGWRRTAGVSSS